MLMSVLASELRPRFIAQIKNPKFERGQNGMSPAIYGGSVSRSAPDSLNAGE